MNRVPQVDELHTNVAYSIVCRRWMNCTQTWFTQLCATGGWIPGDLPRCWARAIHHSGKQLHELKAQLASGHGGPGGKWGTGMLVGWWVEQVQMLALDLYW